MRLGTVRAKGRKGLMLFPNGIGIDFEDLPNGLIALCGANGAGKTRVLEFPILALYGVFPPRPKNALADSVDGRDAFIDCVLLALANGRFPE